MTATVNQWEARYGARRRAIDKKLLAEVEHQIAEEERAIVPELRQSHSPDRPQQRREPTHRPRLWPAANLKALDPANLGQYHSASGPPVRFPALSFRA